MRAITILMACIILFGGAAYAKELQLNPITPDLGAQIKESIDMVSKVESRVKPMVKKMEETYESYNACTKSNDMGCVAIKKQLGQRYKDVLDAVGEVIPKLKGTVNATAEELGRSIDKKTKGKDLRELYEDISKKGKAPMARGPLSKKLSNLLNAMGGSSNYSIMEMSLQTQVDLISASQILEFLEGKVSQLSAMVDLGNDIPVLSEEMTTVMKGVGELFGYDMDFIPEVDAVEGQDGSWDSL